MEHVPVGSILLLIVLDLAIALAVSAVIGVAVARAAGGSGALGGVVGVLVPVVGPLVWALVAVVRRPALLGARRLPDRTARTWTVVGFGGAGAAILVGGSVLAWGRIDGGYREYALASDASAADSGVGLFATVGTALVVAALLVVVAASTAWRRGGIALVLIGVTWLVIGLDALIVFRAVDGLTETVAGASGGRATVSAAPGGGLYTATGAGLLTMVAGVLLCLGDPRRTVTPGVTLAAAPGTWTTPTASDGWSALSAQGDWGISNPTSSPAAPTGGWDPPLANRPPSPYDQESF